ncbi:MAG TPA: ribonuclease D [Chloroflexota bacterium]|jgi:ribonuclease D|nr:ribonuclease D [Chloroflexota bacterium]
MAELNAVMVASKPQLQELVDDVRACGRMGLDTEFLREKTYFARLCLAQVSTVGHVYLVDPVNGLDVGPLAELLAETSIEVVVHAGWQDLQLFYQLSGVVPANVFDVQLAAGFAGYSASLGYGKLVQDVLGVTLEKGEAYSDWCRRPLTDRQLDYAADDVRYLLPAADRLKQQLAELGRQRWLADEMRSLEAADTYAPDEEVWRKVSGQGALSPRQTAVLRELARWREEAAAQRDLPRGWLVKDVTLLEIARRAPSSLAELKAIRGLEPREAERWGAAILATVEKGKHAPAVERAPVPSKTIQNRARMISGLCDALLRARAEQAGIAPELVYARADLDALLFAVLAKRETGATRLMQGWRRELAGEPVVALASGRCALHVVDTPPYIVEVEI